MGVSQLSVMMLQSNDVVFFDTDERSECWICHEPGVPHARVLSCPHDKRPEMEKFVADVKAEFDEAKRIGDEIDARREVTP
jgi:hypothetical protein